MENTSADAEWKGRTRLERPSSQARTGTNFPCSAGHEQDCRPNPFDPYSAICDDHMYITGHAPGNILRIEYTGSVMNHQQTRKIHVASHYTAGRRLFANKKLLELLIKRHEVERRYDIRIYLALALVEEDNIARENVKLLCP